MSPEKLGKRQVGCTFCFTINTSETEEGLFPSVIMMGFSGTQTQVLQTVANS